MAMRQFLSPAQRVGYTLSIIFILLLVLGFAATIPYIWESKSLWYKTGIDKTLLQLGKVFGLFAAVLFFLQIILAQRLSFLDRIFGLDRIYNLHRLNGFLILGLAVLHASLVVLPEGLDNLPIGWKFWPEMLGAALVVMLAFFIVTAYFRRKILAYHLWRKAHRPIGYLLLIILTIHIFNVSDSFEGGVPLIALWALIVLVLLITIVAKIYTAKTTIKRIPVQSRRIVGDDIVSLRLSTPSGFNYAPGQFAFLQLHGHNISPEIHPFTIASAPGGPGADDSNLEFFIKRCGDWTNNIETDENLQASLQAPFGLFSYGARPLPPMLIFIGGGIGITPLLSMLRQLRTEKQSVPLMLIWSLAHKRDMFLGEELNDLREQLPNLQTHIFYTREEGGSRIDRERLGILLQDVPLESHFYLCGPEQMMSRIRHDLQQLKFTSKTIFFEQFSL
ncbi:MAG: ferric reductase-like transmembrane domain-containing protein [Desulfocapsaceae bacterium]|nr:ferric reductase-like transmembrane domain-containing protein [Desulfocapsaceae bacterium]